MALTLHTQPFYDSVEIVGDNPGEPVPEETFTHYSHRGHQSSLSDPNSNLILTLPCQTATLKLS